MPRLLLALLLALILSACGGRAADVCRPLPDGHTRPYKPLSGDWVGEPSECLFVARSSGGCDVTCYPLADPCEVLITAESETICELVATWYR